MEPNPEPILMDDQMCFACGPKNPRGLRLQFELDREKRRLKTRWVPTVGWGPGLGRGTGAAVLARGLEPRASGGGTKWSRPLTKDLQGYRDIVHGGMMGLVLDEMMVNLLWALKEPSVTADLTLKLRRPAQVSEPLDCEAWIREEAGRIRRMEAEAKNSKGEVVARASARCVRIP